MKNLENILTLTSEEKNALSEFSALLRQRLGDVIKEIILFGSKARGDGEHDSDIDVLIVLTRVSWEIKKTISELAAQENLKYNVLISTVRYAVEKWEDPVIKASPFSLSVRNEGVWL